MNRNSKEHALFCVFDRRFYFILILTCVALANAGCKGQRKLVPISGQVKIDGKPLEMGKVTVWVKDSRAAQGYIDKDGRFSLMTYVSGDGCLVGEHEVTVASMRTTNSGENVEYFIPQRYGDPKLSNLKINVDQPNDNWEIELTWKGDSHTGPYIVK
jgi:hypothetical protein